MSVRGAIAGVLVASLFASGAARADEPRVVVRFSTQIPSADAARYVSAMRAQLRDAAVVATEGTGIGVVDVDRGEGGVVLRFVDASGNPMGEPRSIARTGEVGASEAATIVRGFVIALKASAEAKATASSPAPERTGAPLPEAEEAKPEPEAKVDAAPKPLGARAARGEAPAPKPPVAEAPRTAPPPEPWRARIGAMYTGTSYAPELPWQSGARIEGAWSFAPSLYVGAGYAFHPATEIAGDVASVRTTRHALGLFAGIESRGRDFFFGADMGAGVDDTIRSTSRTAPGFSRTGDASSIDPTFALRGHARWRIPSGSGTGIDVAPVFELSPLARSLVVESANAASAALVSPAISRFRLDVGATFDGF